MLPTNTTNRRRTIVPGLVAVALAVSACTGSDANADDGQSCRIAQRLVDEIADGDLDGIERQLDRLGDIDGIDDRTEVDDLEELAEIGDEDALDDLADQIDDDLECGVDVPSVVDITESAPVDTTAPATDPVATQPPPATAPATTEPPATPPPATEPPPTAPPATAPPVTTVDEPAENGPQTTPAVDGQPLTVVDISAGGTVVLDNPALGQDPTELIAEAGVTSLPIPGGGAIGVEYRVDYSVNDFSDTPEFSVVESASFVAATDQTIEQVRDAFSAAIISTTDVDYDITESSASRDDTTQRAVELRADFGSDALSYEVVAAESTESPGLVYIELTARGSRDGALPPLTGNAAAQMTPAVDIAASLGWELAGWSWSPTVNDFSGDLFTTGRLDWAIGSGTETDVAVRSAELLALIPTPEFEDVESDREFYIVNDNEDWSVRHSEVFEGAELRGTYSFTI